MKRLALVITLASLAALTPVGAAPPARQCPTLSVSCPDTVDPGLPVTFTVNVGDTPGDAKLTFNWTVSAGTIMSGQGTTSITVDTTGLTFAGLGSNLTATVDVGGLPESCTGSASCTSALPPGCHLSKVDEYGNLKFNDEKARLDNYAIELQNDPTAQGYLVCYGGRVGREGEARRRCGRAKGYLTAQRHIPADQIGTIDGGHREELTVELWIIPPGVTPPASSPTVHPSEVQLIKGKAKRRART